MSSYRETRVVWLALMRNKCRAMLVQVAVLSSLSRRSLWWGRALRQERERLPTCPTSLSTHLYVLHLRATSCPLPKRGCERSE